MTDIDFIILAGIGSFVLGAILGYLWAFRNAKQRIPLQNIEKELASNENNFKQLQQEVNDHFINLTAHLQQVSESCQDLQVYLTSTAVNLASPEVSRQILKATKLGDQLNEADLSMAYKKGLIGAPKDYAPKVPGGILSEGYGLDESAEHSSIVQTAETVEENEATDPTLQIT